jgi:hypothetical protein
MNKYLPVPGTGRYLFEVQGWCLAPAVTYSMR